MTATGRSAAVDLRLGAVVLAAAAVPGLVLGPAAIGVAIVPLALISLAGLARRSAGETGRDLAALLRTLPGALLVITLAGWLPGVAGSIDPLASASAWARTALFVVLGVVVWLAIGGGGGAVPGRLAAKALLAAAGLAAVIALACLLGPPELLNLVRFQGWVPRSAAVGLKAFANAAMLLLPAVLWAGMRLGGRGRTVAGATAGALLAVILLTEARAAFAGILAMLVLFAVALVVRRRSPILAGALTAGLAGALAIAGLLLLHTERSYEHIRFQPFLPSVLVDLHRQVIWTFVWQRGWEAPLTGHGLDAINRVPGAGTVEPGLGAERLPSHPHNWALEIFAEAGVVGLLPLLGFIAAFGAARVRAYWRCGSPESLTAALVSAGYWASGLFNFSFWAEWWQLSHIVLVALLLAVRDPPPARST